MKRIVSVSLAVLLLICLVGCSNAVGGTYTLTRATYDGKEVTPSSLGMNVVLTLDDNGLGTASWNGEDMEITWAEMDDAVTLEGVNGTLVFTKAGKDLILHDKGAILYFTLPEEPED